MLLLLQYKVTKSYKAIKEQPSARKVCKNEQGDFVRTGSNVLSELDTTAKNEFQIISKG